MVTLKRGRFIIHSIRLRVRSGGEVGVTTVATNTNWRDRGRAFGRAFVEDLHDKLRDTLTV